MNRLLRSTSFKFALLYMTLFAASVGILLAFLYWSTAGMMERQSRETVEMEVQALAERYQMTGTAGLLDLIQKRLQQNPTSASIYLLTDREMKPILGNLRHWPEAMPDQGWVELELSSDLVLDDKSHAARAKLFVLQNGFHLLVGRDIENLRKTQKMVFDALCYGLALTITLGLVGGLLLSRKMMRRVDNLNRTCKQIMAGDLQQRMPINGSNDELDRLAHTLNEMLDRISDLMEGMRRISDSIAHDMRTPLSRLRHTLETGLEESTAEADRRALLERAVDEADGMLSTFNALLRIGKIESGQEREAFIDIWIDQLLSDVVELYEPLAEEKQQQLVVSLQPDLCIEGDRNLLFQAFANLLDNAIKYSPPGGKISLTLSLQDEKPIAEICDSGPGIPASEQKKVFQRFYRAEKSRTTQGNGLGLSLVEAVFRLHDIVISLDNCNSGLSVRCDFSAICEEIPAPKPAEDPNHSSESRSAAADNHQA
ncbi:sensor histidine kinase [Marinobacterium jannaschii]|uniref:sensor histidine kinase n=1 Tax=Marinobacterium jannaschii TaxID=64970 RepID=UPI0004872B6C|nr:HAMP domain-containing sensor histidine kinase [Marinobacterium jannaschii]